MEQEAFYKDQYDRSLDRKSEINSSLSTPIGILSALVAGLLYAASNFEYEAHSVLTGTFIVFGVLSLCALVVSIYHLTTALSDNHRGYEYAYLPDAKDLDAYHAGLLAFYQAQPNLTATQAAKQAQEEFEGYVTGLLINGADNNQKRNKTKTAHRFQCHRYMILAFIFLSLLIIPFGINFGINKGKEKVQQVKINGSVPLHVKIDTIAYVKATKYYKCRQTDASSSANDTRRCRPRCKANIQHRH